MNFSVEHLGLAARDPLLLKNWYVQALGAAEVFHNRQNPPTFLIRMPGGLMIEIYPASHHSVETQYNRLSGWRHVALQVVSVSEARNLLESRGVVITEPVKPAGGGGSVLFFRDPEGNLLHLVERPAGWSPETAR